MDNRNPFGIVSWQRFTLWTQFFDANTWPSKGEIKQNLDDSSQEKDKYVFESAENNYFCTFTARWIKKIGLEVEFFIVCTLNKTSFFGYASIIFAFR